MPEWNGVWYETHDDVYPPSDDTYQLALAVREVLDSKDRFFEVGCGSGVVSILAAKSGAKVLASDRNPLAVRLANRNAKQNRVEIGAQEADLFAGMDWSTWKGQGPTVVAFNPPYLPTGPDDHVEGPLDWAFDGGLDGNEVVLRFAEQVLELPERPRSLLIVHSDLSDVKPLQTALKSRYTCRVHSKTKHFMERLTVLHFQLRA